MDRKGQFGPEVTAFVEQARRFCEFIERAGDLALDLRLAAARERLLLLYQAGLQLPNVDPPEDVDAGPSPARPTSWPGFDRLETYWEVFDPYERDDLVASSLSGDLLDVYNDVRRGLDLWDRDVPGEAAIWEWRFHLDVHWGDHAVDAIRALHRACGRA